MKSLLFLVLALVVTLAFIGTLFFMSDVSEGARFERIDQPSTR